jgi:cytoskeletal protein RodZ
MPTVADQLRLAREERQLTIEQVAELTKIRSDRVRALEAGEFDSFSATVYIRGSVKNYAKMLKLDEVRLLADLDVELKGTTKFSEPPPLIENKQTFLDTLLLLLTRLNWKLGFAGLFVVGIVAAAALGVLWWHHHSKSDAPKNLPPAIYQPGNSGDTLPLPKR